MARGSNRAAPAADGKLVSVRLIEPAKVQGKRCEPDTVVSVPEALAADLVASGAGLLGEGATPPQGELIEPAAQPQADRDAADGPDATTATTV